MPNMQSVLYEVEKFYEMTKLCAEAEPELLAKLGKDPENIASYEVFCSDLLLALHKFNKRRDSMRSWFMITPTVGRWIVKNRQNRR